MSEPNTVNSLMQDLQSLVDAKELLDDLLATYDPYTGFNDKRIRFDVWAQFESRYVSLHSRILTYLKFDDSE